MIYKKSWKYILIKDESNWCRRFNLYRVKSLKDFSDVHKGDIGGYIEEYYNLSQEGNCWIYDKAWVRCNAKVFENAIISGNAKVTDNAQIYDSAVVSGQSLVYGHAKVTGSAKIENRVLIEGIYRK